MVRHSQEIDIVGLGEVVGPNGGILNLNLDSNKYQKPQEPSCGVNYQRHGTEYPKLPQALSSWKQIYLMQRYFHPDTGRCENDGKSLRIGPGRFSRWAHPLLDSLYVLGLTTVMISQVLPEDVISQMTVWRAVDIDQEGLNIHDILHRRLKDDLNIRLKGDQRQVTEFFTMTVIDPPTAGLEVVVKRPIHRLTKRWIDEQAQRSQQHPTQGNLSLHLL